MHEVRERLPDQLLGEPADERGHRRRDPLDVAVVVRAHDDVRGVLRQQPEALSGGGQLRGNLVALRDVAPHVREAVADPHGTHVVASRLAARQALAEVDVVPLQRLSRLHDPPIGVEQAGRLVGRRPVQQPRAHELIAGDPVARARCRVGIGIDEVDDRAALVPDRVEEDERVQQFVHHRSQPRTRVLTRRVFPDTTALKCILLGHVLPPTSCRLDAASVQVCPVGRRASWDICPCEGWRAGRIAPRHRTSVHASARARGRWRRGRRTIARRSRRRPQARRRPSVAPAARRRLAAQWRPALPPRSQTMPFV